MNSDPNSSSDRQPLAASDLPAHVAIIMDGNGRWAKKRLWSRLKGHEKGAETVRTIVRSSREIGIRVLTLFAFSTENWQRPQKEVNALMSLLKKFLRGEREELIQNQIRLNTLGNRDRLPAEVRQVLEETMVVTRDNTGMTLNLALSYGARNEIVLATQALARRAASGEIDPEAIGEDDLAANLFTAGMPDPDLLIRTSGEMRLSNFLLWQIAYAELVITDTLWPDFTREEFISILKVYAQRERRYGRVL